MWANRKRDSLALVTLMAILSLLVSVAHGDDTPGAVAGSQIAGNAGKTAEGMASELQKAIFAGDGEQIGTLLTKLGIQFAIPAGCALLFLMCCYFLASFISRTVGSIVSKKVDLTFGRFLTKAIRTSLMMLALLGVLGYVGVDVTSFAAILAAVGFAVGMALQGTLSNFAAGIMLMVFRPFKVDDYILVEGTEGVVEEIDLFTTRINTLDNRHIIVPNGKIFGNTIENFSRNQYRRVDVNVGTAYEADLDRTRLALINATGNVPGAVESPSSQVVMKALGGSSVEWQVRVWCRPREYWNVRELLVDRTKRALDGAKISIPYPQMDVHVVGKIHAKAA